MISAAVWLAALASGVSAEEPLRNCDDTVTQQDMNWCANQDYLAADAELNRVWPEAATVMQDYDQALEEDGAYDDGRPGYYEALLDAQRAWLKYRDAQCVVEGYWARGGSLEPLLVSTCKTHLTKLRIEDLRELVELSE